MVNCVWRKLGANTYITCKLLQCTFTDLQPSTKYIRINTGRRVVPAKGGSGSCLANGAIGKCEGRVCRCNQWGDLNQQNQHCCCCCCCCCCCWGCCIMNWPGAVKPPPPWPGCGMPPMPPTPACGIPGIGICIWGAALCWVNCWGADAGANRLAGTPPCSGCAGEGFCCLGAAPQYEPIQHRTSARKKKKHVDYTRSYFVTTRFAPLYAYGVRKGSSTDAHDDTLVHL